MMSKITIISEARREQKQTCPSCRSEFVANPDLFERNSYPNPFLPTLSAREIWDGDRIKRENVEELGYRVVYIWENDILKCDGNELIELIVSSLKEGDINEHSANIDYC